MSMMKKFNNLFVNEDDFESEIVEREGSKTGTTKTKSCKKGESSAK